MSSRYYPRYVKGNPQLRVFLPNFWIKLVPNRPEMPQNCVTFKTQVTMSDADIHNYLTKIYKIPVAFLKTTVRTGKLDIAKGSGVTKHSPQPYLTKVEEDYKLAFVKLPPDVKFTFPDLYPEEKREERNKEYEHMQTSKDPILKKFVNENWQNQDVPSWFKI